MNKFKKKQDTYLCYRKRPTSDQKTYTDRKEASGKIYFMQMR